MHDTVTTKVLATRVAEVEYHDDYTDSADERSLLCVTEWEGREGYTVTVGRQSEIPGANFCLTQSDYDALVEGVTRLRSTC